MGENKKHEVDMSGSRMGWGKTKNMRLTKLSLFLGSSCPVRGNKKHEVNKIGEFLTVRLQRAD